MELLKLPQSEKQNDTITNEVTGNTAHTFFALGLFISLYLMCMHACLHVHICTMCLVFWEATRGCQTPWNWSNRL